MITNKGKSLIAKYMLGQVPAYASYLAIGCGGMPRTYTPSKSVTQKAIVGSTVTLTIGSHKFLVGDSIIVSSLGPYFDGTFTITSITSTTITYTGPYTLPTVVTVDYANPSGYAIVDTSSTHYFRVDDRVSFSGITYLTDPSGYFVTSVPSTTQFVVYDTSTTETGTETGTIIFNTVAYSGTVAFNFDKTKQALEFEMLRVPITFRGLQRNDSGKDVVVLGAELPSQNMLDITEIAAFSSGKNDFATGSDSKLMYTFTDTEGWELRSGTGTTPISMYTGSLTEDGANTFNIKPNLPYALSNVATGIQASNSVFDVLNRIQNYEKPRMLDNTVVVRGNLSTNLTTSSYSQTDDYIQLTGQSFLFDKNSSNDQIKLAFSVIYGNVTTPVNPSNVNIVVEFTTDAVGADGERAYALINQTDFSQGRYFTITKKLSDFIISSGFSWSAANIVKIYINTKVAGTTNANYFVALDGMRFENITDSELNSSYGMLGYSSVSTTRDITVSGTTTTVVVPITKNENTTTLLEYNFPLEVT